MHISITTELLGEHPPLLEISIPEIQDDALTSWVRGGDGLIGLESINPIPLKALIVLSKPANGGANK